MKTNIHTNRASGTNLPGIAASLALAVPAWFAGSALPVIGGPVFAILFGMLAGPAFRRDRFVPGIRFTGKKILQYSIILLGFEMHIGTILAVGSRSLFVMLFTLSAAFCTAALMSRVLRVRGNGAILIGVGTSICGGSAIAATAPVIDADEREIAQSISTIFLFNIVAVFIFPAIGRALSLSDTGFGLWAGTAINDTSSVVAAAAAWSERAGNGTALTLATIVKLTRTLMIIPITLALALHRTRKPRDGGKTGSFSLARVFPLFVLGFLLAALVNSFIPLPAALPAALARSGKFMIVMAMAAIGLSTNVRTLLSGGIRPLLLGLCCWIAVAAVSLAVQACSGTL